MAFAVHVMDYLMQNELCTPAKKDAHLSWEGHSLPSSEPQLWLKNISWGHCCLGTRAISAGMTGIYLKRELSQQW